MEGEKLFSDHDKQPELAEVDEHVIEIIKSKLSNLFILYQLSCLVHNVLFPPADESNK